MKSNGGDGSAVHSFIGRTTRCTLAVLLALTLSGAAIPAALAQSGDRGQSGSVVRIEGTGADVKAAGATVSVRGDVGEISAAGAVLDIRATVAKGVQAAGAQVTIDSTVAGDVDVGGGVVEVRGKIGGDVSLGGVVVRFDGVAGGEVNAGGATIDIGPNADITGQLSAGAAIVTVEGRLTGGARLSGAVVTFNGNSGGAVTIQSDQVTIGSRAVITGDLMIRSHNEPIIEEGATISGKVTREQPKEWWWRSGWTWTGLLAAGMAAATILVGFVLLLFARGAFEEAIDRSTRQPVSSGFIGLATLILLPVVAAIIMATLIGITFGFALLLTLPLLIFIGHTVLSACIGAWLLARGGTQRSFGFSLLLVIVGAIVVSLIWMIPWVGPAIAFIAMLIGLGAFFRTLMARLRAPRPVTV